MVRVFGTQPANTETLVALKTPFVRLRGSALTSPLVVSTTCSISAEGPTKSTLSSWQRLPSPQILSTFGSHKSLTEWPFLSPVPAIRPTTLVTVGTICFHVGEILTVSNTETLFPGICLVLQPSSHLYKWVRLCSLSSWRPYWALYLLRYLTEKLHIFSISDFSQSF